MLWSEDERWKPSDDIPLLYKKKLARSRMCWGWSAIGTCLSPDQLYCMLEMDPDPTRAYFWPAVKKRLTRLWPTPMRFFLIRRGKNWKIWDLWGNFPNPNQIWLTRPEQPKFVPIRPGSNSLAYAEDSKRCGNEKPAAYCFQITLTGTSKRVHINVKIL